MLGQGVFWVSYEIEFGIGLGITVCGVCAVHPNGTGFMVIERIGFYGLGLGRCLQFPYPTARGQTLRFFVVIVVMEHDIALTHGVGQGVRGLVITIVIIIVYPEHVVAGSGGHIV